MNENELVARARELFSSKIGDDAAVVGEQVITTDMLVEDVDFTRAVPLPLIARKSLAVNLSDIAAMGARPSHAVVAIGLPEWARDGVDAIMVALRDAAKEWKIEIVGGDFSRADKLVISIAAVGRIEERPLLRSGAKPGDRIFLSRPIGGSAAGLHLLSRNLDALSFTQREFARSAIDRQLDPQPEIDLGLALVRIREVTACIDVSDGLSTDLHHLCDASRCGAEIDRERIPIFPDLINLGPALGVRVQDAVLNGGEEYALLFTASLRESELSARLKRAVYAIGKITSGPEIVIREEGVTRPLEARGWDHFAR
ncbi:MAG TPA: thiamine-phosphate kinase [Thermoanaerobaculia bacterium]|nr:thiamine-phosphate kinase [Thermoanaerobaculia bacterium]